MQEDVTLRHWRRSGGCFKQPDPDISSLYMYHWQVHRVVITLTLPKGRGFHKTQINPPSKLNRNFCTELPSSKKCAGLSSLFASETVFRISHFAFHISYFRNHFDACCPPVVSIVPGNRLGARRVIIYVQSPRLKKKHCTTLPPWATQKKKRATFMKNRVEIFFTPIQNTNTHTRTHF